MPIRTNIPRGYLARLGLVAFATIGFAAWFLYDGIVAWPNQRERGLKFEELVDAEQLGQWDAIATERGWPLENPGKPKTPHAIYGQYIMSGAVAPIGLLFLFLVLRNYGRWIEATEDGLHTSWKQSVKYDQIVTLDKKQWKKKGIARICYEDGNRKKKLVLDDCKYEFGPTAEILRIVEEQIDVDQIINGPPEPIAGDEAEEQNDELYENDDDAEIEGDQQESAEAASDVAKSDVTESDIKDEAV